MSQVVLQHRRPFRSLASRGSLWFFLGAGLGLLLVDVVPPAAAVTALLSATATALFWRSHVRIQSAALTIGLALSVIVYFGLAA